MVKEAGKKFVLYVATVIDLIVSQSKLHTDCCTTDNTTAMGVTSKIHTHKYHIIDMKYISGAALYMSFPQPTADQSDPQKLVNQSINCLALKLLKPILISKIQQINNLSSTFQGRLFLVGVSIV